MSSAAAIYISFAGDLNVTLLGPYDAGDAGVKIMCCRKTVYVPAPYAGLLLSVDLYPVEYWNRLCGAIVDTAAEAPIGLLLTGCAPRLSNPAPIHILRSWSPTSCRPYPTRYSSSTATSYYLATCLDST